MHLIQIPPETVDKLWPLAAAMLDKAVEYSNGAVALDHELVHVMEKRKQLWVVVMDDGEIKNKVVAAGITSLQANPNGTKTANIEMFGGENMKAWFSLKDTFEKWAKDEGCSDVRLWARKGWAKHLPDYNLTHYIMRKELV